MRKAKDNATTMGTARIISDRSRAPRLLVRKEVGSTVDAAATRRVIGVAIVVAVVVVVDVVVVVVKKEVTVAISVVVGIIIRSVVEVE